ESLRVERPSLPAYVRCIERALQAPHADNRARFFGGYRDLVETLIAMAPQRREPRVSGAMASARRATTAATADGASLPAFIIAGGKRCPTGTWHHLLAARPDVSLPQREVGFFDVDADLPLSAYARLFEGAARNELRGERSTMYFASPRGPERIAAALPDAKL